MLKLYFGYPTISPTTLLNRNPNLIPFLGTAIIIIGFAGVLYPLWPQQLRGGVYYLSWGGLGFVGFVIVLAIRKFRLILIKASVSSLSIFVILGFQFVQFYSV